MKVTIKRAGLHTFASFSGADPREVDAAAGDGSPRGRLKRVQVQAKAYPSVKRLHGEIKWIEDQINKPKLSLAVSYALTAVERGLALLDTQRYLRAVVKHGETKAGGKAGALKTNTAKKKRAKTRFEDAVEHYKKYDKRNPHWEPKRIYFEICSKHGYSQSALEKNLAIARSRGLIRAEHKKRK